MDWLHPDHQEKLIPKQKQKSYGLSSKKSSNNLTQFQKEGGGDVKVDYIFLIRAKVLTATLAQDVKKDQTINKYDQGGFDIMKPLFSRRYVTFLTGAQPPVFGAL